MSSQGSSARVAGRLAVFSTLAAMCALLAEYILLSQNIIGYFGFVGFLLFAACCLWSGFYVFAKRYQADWFDRVTEHNKELQLQALFSTLNPWPVLRFDRYGQLISKNSRAKTFFYAEAKDAEKRSVFDFFPEMKKEDWQELVYKEEPLELEYNRSGYWLCFYFRAHLQLGVINVYGYDVTRYKRLQQEAAQSQSISTQAALKTNELLFDTFRSLHGPARELQEALDKDKVADKEAVNKTVRRDIKAITEIVFRLEDIADLEPEQFKLQPRLFDCRFMFEKVLSVAAKKAFDNGGELVLDCDFGCSDQVITDGRRLQQALEGMLRFSLLQAKNGTVFVKSRWISAVGISEDSALDHSAGYSSDTNQMALRVTVHDSGQLDEKVLQLLGQGVETRDNTTTGLDLNIRFLASLVPLVGGRMTARASPLGGNELTLDWPVQISKTHVVATPTMPLADKRIFVFDYVELSSEALARALSREGAQVDYCSDPLLLLEKMSAQKIDVLMYSERRGSKFDQTLLEQAKATQSQVPAVCLLTHYGENLNSSQFDNLAVQSIISKPIRSSLLVQGVEHAWSLAQKTRATGGVHAQEQPKDTDGFSVPAPSKALLDLMNSHEPVKVVSKNVRPAVLVVDDDMVVLHLVSDLLTEIGVDVEVAGSAEKGLHLMNRFEFDLIIMDVRMPEMNGFEATQEIRAIHGESVPIMALTASDEPADRAKALQIGMNDYLVKPVDRETLMQRLGRWVDLPGMDKEEHSRQAVYKIDQETPLIQVREAIRLLSQDTRIFTRSLLRFYGRFSAEGIVLRKLITEKSGEDIIRRLHSLRGGAANIGAYQLRDQIFLVEKVLHKDGVTSESAQSMDELLDLLNKAIGEASKLLVHFLQESSERLENTSMAVNSDLEKVKGVIDRLTGTEPPKRLE